MVSGAWIFSVASAFMIGRQLASNVSGDRSSDSPRNFTEKVSATYIAKNGRSEEIFTESDGLVPSEDEVDYVDPRSVVPSLRAALKISDPVKRLRLITLALEGLDSSNVREALAVLENQPGGGFARARDLNLLMYAWGSFDGSAALEYAENELRGRTSRFASYTAMSGWAANEPQAALAYVEVNSSGDSQLLGLVSGWASTDLASAAEYVKGLPEGSDRDRAIGIVVNNFLQEGAEYAAAWAESLPEGDYKFEVVKNLSRQWASVDAPSTAQWVTGYAETEMGERAVAVVASQWARDDPEAAALWASSFQEDGSRESSLQAVFNRWGGNDPNAAGEWLNSLPPQSSLDPAVDAFARRISGDDPQGALTWAESIIDSEMRLKSVTIVGQEWYRQDPEAATQWVETSQLPTEVQTAIVNPPQEESQNDRRGFFGRGQ